MKSDEHLFLVTYDIADPKRWRYIYRLMCGYGEWLQLSVFQCRLSRRRHAELIALLDGIIHHSEDHVVLMDLGLADTAAPRVVSLGKDFKPVERAPIIVRSGCRNDASAAVLHLTPDSARKSLAL